MIEGPWMYALGGMFALFSALLVGWAQQVAHSRSRPGPTREERRREIEAARLDERADALDLQADRKREEDQRNLLDADPAEESNSRWKHRV